MDTNRKTFYNLPHTSLVSTHIRDCWMAQSVTYSTMHELLPIGKCGSYGNPAAGNCHVRRKWLSLAARLPYSGHRVYFASKSTCGHVSSGAICDQSWS